LQSKRQDPHPEQRCDHCFLEIERFKGGLSPIPIEKAQGVGKEGEKQARADSENGMP